MPPKVSLEAVLGRLCPVPGKRGAFYGLRPARGDVADADVVHTVPDGDGSGKPARRYVSAGPFAVEARADGMPRDPYLRRAVMHGDLARAAKAAPKLPAAPVKE